MIETRIKKVTHTDEYGEESIYYYAQIKGWFGWKYLYKWWGFLTDDWYISASYFPQFFCKGERDEFRFNNSTGPQYLIDVYTAPKRPKLKPTTKIEYIKYP